MAAERKGPERDASGRFVSNAKGSEPAPDDDAFEGEKVAEGHGDVPDDETPIERVERLAKGDLHEGEWVEDISDTIAPSVGPKSVVFHHPGATQRGDIDLDAMGNDKRRQVVGNSYGPSFAKQATMYGLFVALVVGVVIGGKFLIDKADQPPKTVAIQAPWAQPGVKQHPPKPLQ